MPYLICSRIKVVKVLCVKYALVTGIAKGIARASYHQILINQIYSDDHWSHWPVDT